MADRQQPIAKNKVLRRIGAGLLAIGYWSSAIAPQALVRPPGIAPGFFREARALSRP